MSRVRRRAIAEAMVRSLADGGFGPVAWSDDFWAWTLTSGDLTKDQFLQRVRLFGAVFADRAEITIDSVTGEDGRVFVQFRVHGDLITGETYRQTAAFMVEFDGEDRVRHWREYFDARVVADLLFPAMRELEARQARA